MSYPVHYVILRPSLDEAARRATARTAPGALLDQEPSTHMYRSFVDLGEFGKYVLDTPARVRPKRRSWSVRLPNAVPCAFGECVSFGWAILRE